MKHVVILGGGFGGIYTAKRLLKHCKVTLINPVNYFLFTPMLHEVAVGTVNRHNIVQPIRELLSHDNFRFIRAKASSIDIEKKEIVYKHGQLLYDYAVIAIGARSHYFGVKGAKEHAHPIKNVHDAINIRTSLIKDLEKLDQGREEKMHVVVIGAGATGVEMAADISDFLHEQLDYFHNGIHNPQVTIVQAVPKILPICDDKTRKHVMKKLEKKGIDVITDDPVTRVTADTVTTKSGKELDASTIIWSGGVVPNNIKMDDDLVDDRGFIKVNKTLKAADGVYALGDCAKMPQPMPLLAQVATKQAKTVADNILRELESKKPQVFDYKTRGLMVSVGEKYAVAELYSPKKIHLKGTMPWFLKRHIYLMQLIGLQNKIKVGLEWFLNLIFPRDGSEI